MRMYFPCIAGVKILALLAVFAIHVCPDATPHAFRWSVGSAAVHLFFCTSGFLVACRYWDDVSFSTWEAGVGYTWGKICKFYPVFLCAFMIGCLALDPVVWKEKMTYVDALFNLFLLQSWCTQRVAFSFNGADWFLSSILPCYLMAPILLQVLKRLRSWLVLAGISFGAMVTFEILQMKYSNAYFGFDLYTFPVMRILEFACAMCAYPLMRKLEKMPCFPCSLIELGLAGGLAALVSSDPMRLSGSALVPLYVILIAALGTGRGMLSRILSWPAFARCSAVEMEFFLFHWVVLACGMKFFPGVYSWPVGFGVTALFVTVALCLAYRGWAGKVYAPLVQKALERGRNLLWGPEAERKGR